MKIFIIAILIFPFTLFAVDNSEIDKKLNYIIEKMNRMEKELKSKDREINKLKSEIKEQNIKTKNKLLFSNCNKIAISNFKSIYNGEILPYYDFSFQIANKYPADIVSFSGKLMVKDKDGSTLVVDFIKRDKVIKAGESIVINKRHSVISEIEKILKDEKPSDILVYFIPANIKFRNGQYIECGGRSFLNINFLDSSSPKGAVKLSDEVTNSETTEEESSYLK